MGVEIDLLKNYPKPNRDVKSRASSKSEKDVSAGLASVVWNLMRKLIFTTIAISISILTFSQGLIWNDEIKEQMESSFKKVETTTRSYYPSSYSLEKYTSYVHHQGKTAMCVAYSLANCRTIIYAKNKRLRGKKEITAESFSPFFIYYHV